MRVEFSEQEFQEIGEAYVRRAENDELGGKESVTFYEDDEDDTQAESDAHEPVRLDAGESYGDEDEELSEEEACERLADGESVAMWEVDE